MSDRYDFKNIDKKWQKIWEENKTFQVSEDSQRDKKYYVLEMFPYPSGKIHMGHVRNYTIGDVISRFKKMQGYNVLHPMGWDAFGLPAENAAIQRGIHPSEWTWENIGYMRTQMKRMGLSYDWDREIATCHQDYYQWTQWIFLKMYEMGLTYRKKAMVNWCESCKTVLANEQVEGGLCWRCDTPVDTKELEQWFLRITKYSEELLKGCEDLISGWPERVLTMQKNWIGKSYGVEINFPLEGSSESITVFTTRQDTLFGATFMSLAPEHPLSSQLPKGTSYEKDVNEFIYEVLKEGKIKRASEEAEKKGVFTGRYAINPVTGMRIPIWIANFVLMDYGTGAIMAVPAHDQRDLDFAREYDLPVKVVIHPYEGSLNESSMTEAHIEDGYLVSSDDFDGMNNREAMDKIADFLEKKGIGKKTVNYRLKDWGISRQRYWGAPIPVVYCDQCGIIPAPYESLPVLLPLKIEFKKTKKLSLEDTQDFVNTECPKCGERAKRETDTMDTFICSSWYFLRYTCARYKESPIDTKTANYWMPVDQYIGGIEHAVMHLLYARFFTMVLRDAGLIKVGEPFKNLLTQGMVLKDGSAMSKSRGNIVDPEDIIEKYGADTARIFIIFASPPEKELDWSDQGVEGAFRFLNRIWRLVNNYLDDMKDVSINHDSLNELSSDLKDIRRKTHQTIKKVTDDIGKRFHLNTAISAIMELINTLYKWEVKVKDEKSLMVLKEAVLSSIILLSPFAPHIAEEMWQLIGNKEELLSHPWPSYEDEITKEEEIELVVQVNGKVRARVSVSADEDEEELKRIVLGNQRIKEWVKDKYIKKYIIIPNKLVNIVI
ncbi:MAG TPA: leucine--tRNA ligase [Nitrospinota bacterium]|nr:leucine--tRNA ligase [Nitrospinota bacterium]